MIGPRAFKGIFVSPPVGGVAVAGYCVRMSTSRQRPAAEQLATPVQFLKGAGPERAAILQKLGLNTVRDLLFFFPRDYEDASDVRPIDQLVEGEAQSVWGVVEEVEMRNTGIGRTLLGVLIRQGPETLRATWFNQGYLRDRFVRGARVMFSGVPKRHGLRWEMTHPRITSLSDSETPTSGQILPIYSLTEGVSQPQMRKVVQTAVEGYASLLDEVFPDEFLDEHRLWPIRAALPQMHQPTTRDTLAEARRRFVYQELLVLQLGLALRRRRRLDERKAPAMPVTPLIDSRILRLFPFDLTPDQRQAMTEIGADLGREVPMNRLLQGDVGSGKTVVAQYAMLVAVANGRQAVLMAPTEVLARQHARNLQRSLAASKVRIGVLTGGISTAERRELLEQIAAGQIDLVIGTQAVVHAIARSEARFANLGLVVIDEQHKFGVRQRAVLKQAGLDPHYLVMTATPIPRTVAMTLFGDLDVSILRSSPPGRQPVHSYWVGEDKREGWWEFFRKKLREGRQGYVIAPLVDEIETLDDPLEDGLDNSLDPANGDALENGAENAPENSTETAHVNSHVDASLNPLDRSLPRGAGERPIEFAGPASGGANFHGGTLGVESSIELRGSAERNGGDHRPGGEPHGGGEGKIGEPAGRAGEGAAGGGALANVERLYEELVNGPLADFRVDLIHGRMSATAKEAAMEAFRTGETQVLVSTSVVEVGVDVPNASLMTIESGERFGLAQLHQLRGRIGRGRHPGYLTVFADPKNEAARRRLEAFVKTTDGFELAELDFGLRGPGEIFGVRQHGLPPFRIADLQRDAATVLEARRDAQALLAGDAELSDPKWARLRRMVLIRYGEALDLGDVG